MNNEDHFLPGLVVFLYSSDSDSAIYHLVGDRDQADVLISSMAGVLPPDIEVNFYRPVKTIAHPISLYSCIYDIKNNSIEYFSKIPSCLLRNCFNQFQAIPSFGSASPQQLDEIKTIPHHALGLGTGIFLFSYFYREFPLIQLYFVSPLDPETTYPLVNNLLSSMAEHRADINSALKFGKFSSSNSAESVPLYSTNGIFNRYLKENYSAGEQEHIRNAFANDREILSSMMGVDNQIYDMPQDPSSFNPLEFIDDVPDDN